MLWILERVRKGERQGEKYPSAKTCIVCLSHSPNLGTGPKYRLVPWPGIDTWPFGLWDRQHSTHCATQSRERVFVSLFTQENTEAYTVNHFPVTITMVNNLRFKPRLHDQDLWSLITVFLSLASRGLSGSTNTHWPSYHLVYLQVPLQPSNPQMKENTKD